MSLELEVRSDDDYSRSAPRQKITALLLDQWSAQKKTDDFLLHTEGGCHVEVSLERAEAPDRADAVVSVGFRVPAGASMESGDRSLQMARAVADALGWRVFDPQRDDYVDSSELGPGPSFRESLARLGRETRLVGGRAFWRKLVRRAWQQSVFGMLTKIVLGFGAAVAVGWLFRFSFETRPTLFLGLTAGVSIALLGLDIVTDVLGEVHQEAVRAQNRGDES